MRAVALAAVAIVTLSLCAEAQGPHAAHQAAAMRQAHRGDAPVANASARAPAQQVVSEWVTYGKVGGRELKGYLARPATAKPNTPAVLVVHEWWGINDNVKMMTDRIAGEGYVALAVDLMKGVVTADPAVAEKLYIAGMEDVSGGEANLDAALKYLNGRGSKKIGTIGWCFGGHWSLRAGLVGGDRVHATVMYYGQPITDPKELARLRSPLLGHFGVMDQGIPVDTVRTMETALKRSGGTVKIEVHHADHGFANPSGKVYNLPAAEAAWASTVAFWRKQLGE